MGRSAEKREFLETSVANLRESEADLLMELFAYVLADGLLQDGKVDEACSALEIGFENIAVTRADIWRPELHRLRAEALRAAGVAADDVEAEFAVALAAAQRQHTKLLELRAACGLARFKISQGADRAAHDLLQPLYGWFTEGFDTPDLRDAKLHLNDLA